VDAVVAATGASRGERTPDDRVILGHVEHGQHRAEGATHEVWVMTSAPYRDPVPTPSVARRSYRSRVIAVGVFAVVALGASIFHRGAFLLLGAPLFFGASFAVLDLGWRPLDYGLLGALRHSPWPDEPPLALVRPYVVKVGLMSFSGWLVTVAVFPSGLGLAVRPFFGLPPARVFIPREALRRVRELGWGRVAVEHDGREVRSPVTVRGDAVRTAIVAILPAERS
jgi:hypothetical protein